MNCICPSNTPPWIKYYGIYSLDGKHSNPPLSDIPMGLEGATMIFFPKGHPNKAVLI